MSNKQSLKPLAIAVGAALATSASMGIAQADTNPFGMSALSSGYEMPAGEGSCGAAKGEDGKSGEAKDHEGKCGEGKCGEDKGMEGKCGEGKCGEGKCGEDKDMEDMEDMEGDDGDEDEMAEQ